MAGAGHVRWQWLKTAWNMGFLLLIKIILGNFKFREYTISVNITEVIPIKCFLPSEIRC